MIGDVPTATGLIKRDALLPQHVFAREQMLALAVASLRNHMRMLAEEQHVPDATGFARRHDALLQSVRFRVVDEAEVDGEAVGH